jgi:branched-chain amino acid transport system ATP-binding protein
VFGERKRWQKSLVRVSRQMLDVHRIRKCFGGITAVDDVSFTVQTHSITGLIGPNGSGKTVTFNLITGLSYLETGVIRFQGGRLSGLPPYEITRRGIGRTFQNLKVFSEFSVEENLFVMGQPRDMRRCASSIFRRSRSIASGTKVEELLRLVNLWDKREEPAGSLSYGQQKLLSFVALMAMRPEPELILLDEPMAGVNPTMITTLVRLIRSFREGGKTFLIIEHDMRVVMDLCDTIVVLDHGRKIEEGPPDKIQRSERVIEAYFGH